MEDSRAEKSSPVHAGDPRGVSSGCAIPVPFVTGSALSQMFSNGNMLSYLDMMSGGALSRCTLFALGVTPYINASIIVQLLTVAIPSLENIAKEPDGQNKLQQITRYAGGVIALVMSLGYYFVVRNMGALKYTTGAAGIFTAVVIIATFTAGAQLITWCGEQIDDKGIGNGLSLLIFSSIVSNWSGVYTTVTGLLTRAAAGETKFYILLPLLVVLALVVIVFIVIMTNAERRITIQYAKRVVGRKQMGGQNSYLPLKLNMSGVMPIIFASALVSIPGTVGSFLQIDQAAHPFWYAFFHTFNYTSALYVVIYLLLILASTTSMWPSSTTLWRSPTICAVTTARSPASVPASDQRFPDPHPEQDHPHRRDLPGCGGCTADHPRQPDRYEHPAGRYQPADRCGCCTRHDPQPGQLHDDAQPQRLPRLIQ